MLHLLLQLALTLPVNALHKELSNLSKEAHKKHDISKSIFDLGKRIEEIVVGKFE